VVACIEPRPPSLLFPGGSDRRSRPRRDPVGKYQAQRCTFMRARLAVLLTPPSQTYASPKTAPKSFPCHTSRKSPAKSNHCHTSKNPLPQVLCLPHLRPPPPCPSAAPRRTCHPLEFLLLSEGKICVCSPEEEREDTHVPSMFGKFRCARLALFASLNCCSLGQRSFPPCPIFRRACEGADAE